MQSNIHDFPAEEFLECLRNNRTNSDKYIQQVNNLNTEWIYEIVKHCHNSILETKELPATKLNALLMIRDLMETCQIPCFNLIETYILPIVYQTAIEKPQDRGERRGSSFFQQNGKVSKSPNIEQIGIKFVALCAEILSAGSIIKPKRTFQNQQLQQKSSFAEYFDNFKKYGISETPNSLASLKNFSSQFASKGRQDYLRNLHQFYRGKNNYGEYFVTKIMDSVETDTNPLLNNGQSVSSLSNDLDMRMLLRQGDPIITSPLIDQLLLKLKNIPSFMAKKHCLSLLTDFVKWGDVEAILKLCYDGSLEAIGLRIAEVDGSKGSVEGEKIYPEVKGQRDGKRKFYIEYLKSLQVIAKCFESQKNLIQQAARIQQLFNYFKQQKFEFPQNLMIKRIQTDFPQNLKTNQQRNLLVSKKLKQQGITNQKRGVRSSRQLGMSATLIEINRNLEDCLEEIFKVSSNQNQINARMTRIVQLKNRFEDQIDKIDENNSEIKEDQIEDILDNGQEITKIVEKLQVLHNDYKNKTINFEEFKLRHASITKQYEEQSLDQSRTSLKNDKNSSSNNTYPIKNSLEQVVNSFNIKKHHVSQNITPTFQNTANQYEEQVKSNIKVGQNGGPVKTPIVIENDGKKLFSHTAAEHNNRGMMPDAYYTQPNHVFPAVIEPPLNIQHQNQQQVLNQVTSSILSNKSQKKKPLKSESKISEMKYEDGSSKVISESHSLRERIQARKKQRQSKLKQLENGEVEQLSKQQQSRYHSVQNGSSFKNSQGQPKSNLSRNEKVQYIQYISHESIKVEKSHFNEPNGSSVRSNNANNFTSTAPQLNNLRQNNKGQSEYYSTYQNGAYPVKNVKNQETANGNYSGSPYNFAVVAKAQDSIKIERINESVSSSSRSNSKKSGLISNIKPAKEQSSFSRQMNSQNSSTIKKQNSKKSGFANALQNPIVINIRDHISEPGQESQFRTCKGQLSQNEYMEDHERNYVMNSNQFAIQQKRINPNYAQNNHNQYFQAKSSGFSNSASIRMHIQPNNNPYYEDEKSEIKQPSIKPLQNSYYAPEDIENEVKKSKNMQFKDCLQIQKELIPISHNFRYDVPELLTNQNGLKSRTIGASNVTNKISTVKPHEQYMMAKLKRELEKQKDNSVKQLNSRVFSLKIDNSRLRNELTNRVAMNARSGQTQSDRYSSVQEFSNSKSRQSNSPQMRKPGFSGVSTIFAPGNPIDQNMYSRFFTELTDERVKKASLRNKTIVYRSDLWEIGCMFKSTQQLTNLTLYLTPEATITNFSYSVSRQLNLQIQIASKGYSQIPAGKQAKLQLMCKLQNIPYNLPLLTLRYRVGNEQKTTSFYLPLTFNKFIRFASVDPSRINQQLKSSQKLLKNSQFDINTKLAKTSSIKEYFPSITNLGEQTKQQITRYGTIGTFRNQSFIFLITTKGRDRILLQGKPSNQNYTQYVEYLILTIKNLMTF